MESTDREILLAIQAEQARQREEFLEFRGEVRQELDSLHTELVILNHDAANIQTSVYCVLGAIGIFLAALVIPSIIRKPGSTSSHQEITNPEEIVDSVSNAMMRAFAQGRDTARGE